VLFFIMGIMLSASFGAERSMREGFTGGTDVGTEAARLLVRLYAALATLGTIALGLGLWLAGT
jgi:hypothetical protein